MKYLLGYINNKYANINIMNELLFENLDLDLK